jgi:hypothetical protein
MGRGLSKQKLSKRTSERAVSDELSISLALLTERVENSTVA